MKDREIDAAIETAKARKAKLQQLLKLRRQIHALECKYFLTDDNLTNEFHRIAEIVIKHFGVPLSCLVERSNKSIYVVPRHTVMYLLRRITGAPVEKIGELFKRDHTTILNACDRIEARISTERKFADEFDSIKKACEKERHEVLGN